MGFNMMKSFATLALLTFSTASLAVVNADGCYQSFQPGAMYPAVCITGTNEEAVVPTAEVAIFGTNTDNVIWCAKVTRLERLSYEANKNHTELSFDPATGMRSILLNGAVLSSGDEEGQITFSEVSGSAELQYLRIDEATTARLLREKSASELCANL